MGPVWRACRGRKGSFMANTKVLLTGAAGYIASQLLPTFRERYDLVLVDVTQKNRQGEELKDIVVLDLIEPPTAANTPATSKVWMQSCISATSAVVALTLWSTSWMRNETFARWPTTSSGRPTKPTSNGSSWPAPIMLPTGIEHALIHQRAMEVLEPYTIPLRAFDFGCHEINARYSGAASFMV